jgi:hypothetical protein
MVRRAGGANPVPALWHKREILAYSRTSYANKSWQLPDE